MLGAIVGDIVGSRFEFNNHRNTNFELFHKDCSYTDDTICTVAVADWLMNPSNNLSSTMRLWCHKYPNPVGGYGSSFRQWVFTESGPYNSFGNGSAMRVSPAGWLSTHEDAMAYSIKSAEITHDHPEGIKGAECIAYAIWHLRNGFNKKWVKGMAETNYGYNLNQNCDQIRRSNTFNETCQVTVPQAIVCFLESTDFESAIRLAVSIGGDTDTIAAITGSLAEAFYGIPPQITLKALDYLPEDIVEVIESFSRKIMHYKHEQTL